MKKNTQMVNPKPPQTKKTGSKSINQDFFVLFISFVIVLVGSVLILWSFNQTNQEQKEDTLIHDTAWVQQQIQISLSNLETQINNLSLEIQGNQYNSLSLQKKIHNILKNNPEIDSLNWYINPQKSKTLHLPLSIFTHHPPTPEELTFAQTAFTQTAHLVAPRYTHLHIATNDTQHSLINFIIPILHQKQVAGLLVARLSIERILKYNLPHKLNREYAITIIDPTDHIIASNKTINFTSDTRFLQLPLNLYNDHFNVRVYADNHTRALSNKTFFLGMLGLCLFVLIYLWHYNKKRWTLNKNLYSDTFFQRSIENANQVSTRTLDLSGKIIHVNRAFCRLTGWGAEELIGHSPPYPYWPKDQYSQMHRHIEMTLSGKIPSSGLEAQILRKDGSTFHARFYVSPLIDSQGKQTGWIASISDITERLKAKEELTAAHQRLTTVLENLHTAVSVLKIDQSELLFANHYYRQLFGIDHHAHLALTQNTDPLQCSAETSLQKDKIKVQEVFIEKVNKWFEVRIQYIQWVDGYLAQLQIATDITDRKLEQEKTRQEEEKLQFTSRLITMGEMASSIAHELNQPLAAISNYCSGALTLLNQHNLNQELLMSTLKKAAEQALKAGMIIKRVRAFVKRSEPKQQAAQLTDIIADAIGLMEIEARRQHVTIIKQIHTTLPEVHVDPVLIEQVLVNLIKNAAESMSEKQTKGEIIVKAQIETAFIKISIIDQGMGMNEEVIAEKLFEPFYSTKENGMGMGLNICRSIIEMHNGQLWAQNHFDSNAQIKGAVFHCTLPIQQTTPLLLTHFNSEKVEQL